MASRPKIYENLKKVILQWMRGKSYSPAGQTVLFEKLSLPAQHHKLCKEILDDLVAEGELTLLRKQYHLKSRAPTAKQEAQQEVRPKAPSRAAKPKAKPEAQPRAKPKEDREATKPASKRGSKPSAATNISRRPQESTRGNLTVEGRLRTSSRGFGFVAPADRELYPKDIFIPRGALESAIDGDIVEVNLTTAKRPERGPEGEIIRVVKRGRSLLAGTVHYRNTAGHWFAHIPILGSERPAQLELAKDEKVEKGERYLFSVVEWGEGSRPTLCKLEEKIGTIEDALSDIPVAIHEFELSTQFPKDVLAEAKKFGTVVRAQDKKGRIDLTDRQCFTIDPETAKDFDDALDIEKLPGGGYKLGVHIADVAAYVKEGDALDLEAMRRGNSTYLPGQCLPMLPEELSNGLCSLKPRVVRLSASVLMEFDPLGELVNYKIVRGFIRSRNRFSYEQAFELLQGKKKSPYLEALQQMVELCGLLKKKRYDRGSIDFSMPEVVLILDKKGVPTGLKRVEYDITHQLVEEFMLKANEVVAKDLTEKGLAMLYRIHQPPAEENLDEFFSLARMMGFTLPPKPTTEDLQKLFEVARTTPYAAHLAVLFIRSMRQAYYSAENVGHFGLSLEHYCHFTSPIRRYTDLVISRLLFGETSKEVSIEKIALHCSEQERTSFRAEMSVKLLKKLRYLDLKRNEGITRHKAVITRIRPFGLTFEIDELMFEGSLHISELGSDYFVWNEKAQLLQGRHTGRIFRACDQIEVELLSIDLILVECQWRLADAGERRKKRR